MARSVNEILNEMIEAKNSNEHLANLNSTSSTAIWRLLFYIVAVSHHILERLWGIHKIELNNLLVDLKPHSLRWYANKAKMFQYGFSLLPDSDMFDNSSATEQQIADSKIIAYSAANELGDLVQLKVAKIAGSDLSAVDSAELAAFNNYMQRVKDAGVKLEILSLPAESLKLTLTVYYDPLILNSDGSRVDGTDAAPVQNAVKEYLKNISFDGTYVSAHMIDAVQRVDGVDIPHVNDESWKYAELPWQAFEIKYRPLAGYIRIADDADLTINFIAKSY